MGKKKKKLKIKKMEVIIKKNKIKRKKIKRVKSRIYYINHYEILDYLKKINIILNI